MLGSAKPFIPLVHLSCFWCCNVQREPLCLDLRLDDTGSHSDAGSTEPLLSRDWCVSGTTYLRFLAAH